jgi:hypothetical protein
MRRRDAGRLEAEQMKAPPKVSRPEGYCDRCGQVFKPAGLKRHRAYCNE